MGNGGLGSFWTLILPDFSGIFSGEVEAVTPVLVLVIWAVALYVARFAVGEAKRAKVLIDQTTRLLDGLEPESLYDRRGEIAERANELPATIRDAWREFDDSLVTESGRLYTTVGAAEFFNEQRFAPRLVGNRFLHAAPTALTTLGLLGTFLGLTVGLRGLDLGSTSDELRTGIQTLVDGAALGFTASLWGVFMSLATNVIERWQEREVVKHVERLQARLDALFRMKSPEQSLSDIAAASGESKEALQVLHEKIGSALQESVQYVGESTSRAVSEALNAALAPVMQEIAQRAANQSADVFKEVSAQLTSSFHQIGASLADELKSSAESMRATLEDMGRQLSHHTEEHLDRLGVLEKSAFLQLGAVNDAIARQVTMLEQSLPTITSGLDQAATIVGAATQEMQSVSSILARVSTGFGETSSTLGQMLADAIGTMDELARKTAGAAGALAQQQGSVTDLTTQAVAAARMLETASGP